MKNNLNNKVLLLATIFASNVAIAAPVGFQDPSASWGGWARGDTDTSYIHWAQIDALIDSSPDQGNTGASTAFLIANNPGAFLTGGGAGGNVYSFSDTPSFLIAMGTDYAVPAENVTIALQLKVLGTELDLDSVKLGGVSWDSTETLFSGAAVGPFGGSDKEYLFIWENVTPEVGYGIDFLATGSSMSLDEVSLDIGVSAVPLPATAWMFLSALSGLAAVRRKVT